MVVFDRLFFFSLVKLTRMAKGGIYRIWNVE